MESYAKQSRNADGIPDKLAKSMPDIETVFWGGIFNQFAPAGTKGRSSNGAEIVTNIFIGFL